MNGAEPKGWLHAMWPVAPAIRGLTEVLCAGNTCFVNVALQCLRYTPKLPQAIYPDLVRFSLIEQEPVAMPVSVESTTESAPSFDPMHSGSDLPSVPEASALADVATQISTPSASLNSQPDGFATSNSNLNATDLQQSMHSTGQARSNLNTAEPQQSMHSTSGPDQHQLSQDQQAQMQASQPIGVPASHAGLTSHSRVSHQEQLHASSPQSLAGSRLSSLASSDSVNASPRTVTEASPVGIADNPGAGTLLSNPASQQQQQMQQQQSYAESAQPGADPTHGDDSDKAPPNESIPAKQPPPVAAPQVPLKKGDIAESFRTLVKQVCLPLVFLFHGRTSLPPSLPHFLPAFLPSYFPSFLVCFAFLPLHKLCRSQSDSDLAQLAYWLHCQTACNVVQCQPCCNASMLSDCQHCS